MYKKLINPANTPMQVNPYISVSLSKTNPRCIKHGATAHANAKLSATVNQNVRHGRQLNGLNRKGSLITWVNSQPNTKAVNELSAINAVTPSKKISVSIVLEISVLT